MLLDVRTYNCACAIYVDVLTNVYGRLNACECTCRCACACAYAYVCRRADIHVISGNILQMILEASDCKANLGGDTPIAFAKALINNLVNDAKYNTEKYAVNFVKESPISEMSFVDFLMRRQALFSPKSSHFHKLFHFKMGSQITDTHRPLTLC